MHFFCCECLVTDHLCLFICIITRKVGNRIKLIAVFDRVMFFYNFLSCKLLKFMSDLVLLEVLDMALQHGLTSQVDRHILYRTSKHGVQQVTCPTPLRGHLQALKIEVKVMLEVTSSTTLCGHLKVLKQRSRSTEVTISSNLCHHL